jgi:tripartite-type tricarboxylate transporter receptor subunit TctC
MGAAYIGKLHEAECKMKRRAWLKFGIATWSLAILPSRHALAQSKYPERPIKLLVPFPPGGVNDPVGRVWADKVKPLLGTVIVDNQGGAGGSVGAAAVARAQPDGYTILLGSGGAMFIRPIASTRPTYDPQRDFEPIAILATTGLIIAVHPSVPVHTLKELIDYARANRGKLSYGTAGIGTVNHVGGELFKSLTGLSDILHVPYKGAGPALADLLGGQIPLAFPNVTSQVLALHRSGKLRMLAVTTSQRMSAAPDIPTAEEAGVPGMVAQNVMGLYLPAHTPPAIIEQLALATRKAAADAEYLKQLSASGAEPFADSTPEKARQIVADEIARYTPVIKAIGLNLD